MCRAYNIHGSKHSNHKTSIKIINHASNLNLKSSMHTKHKNNLKPSNWAIKFELMLIHPIAGNTLKFPSKFKLEIGKIKA